MRLRHRLIGRNCRPALLKAQILDTPRCERKARNPSAAVAREADAAERSGEEVEGHRTEDVWIVVEAVKHQLALLQSNLIERLDLFGRIEPGVFVELGLGGRERRNGREVVWLT